MLLSTLVRVSEITDPRVGQTTRMLPMRCRRPGAPGGPALVPY
jgi:hypothetical protein